MGPTTGNKAMDEAIRLMVKGRRSEPIGEILSQATGNPLPMNHLLIKKLQPNAIIPEYQTEGSVAFDLHSCESGSLQPGETRMFHTGLAIELPKNHEMQIRQRSGMSLNFPNYITIGVGTIDEDYRGEITIPIKNNNNKGEYLTITSGDRIAQAIVSPVTKCHIIETNELSGTERGKGGFGSTGE
jgi:dUTP pyrophosphatase